MSRFYVVEDILNLIFVEINIYIAKQKIYYSNLKKNLQVQFFQTRHLQYFLLCISRNQREYIQKTFDVHADRPSQHLPTISKCQDFVLKILHFWTFSQPNSLKHFTNRNKYKISFRSMLTYLIRFRVTFYWLYS